MARNKYPGYCYCCGKYVKPGYGHFERHYGHWRIKCVKCASGRIVKDTDREVQRINRQIINLEAPTADIPEIVRCKKRKGEE